MKEQNTRYKELENTLKKDTEIDNKRKALQELQVHYQTQLDNDFKHKQECANKDTRIRELEGELNRLKNYSQTPEKRREIDETNISNSQGTRPKTKTDSGKPGNPHKECSGYSTDPSLDGLTSEAQQKDLTRPGSS